MRIATIDILKILSIFFVVMAHTTLFFLNRNGNDVILCFLRQTGHTLISRCERVVLL